MTKHLPNDIYCQCVTIAKSYYTMLQRRKELTAEVLYGSSASDGQPRGNSVGDPTFKTAERLILLQSRNDHKIKAVEQAWARMEDQTTRDFVKFNLFEGLQMQYIDLPMSIRTMKRTRSRFIRYLAEELGEI